MADEVVVGALVNDLLSRVQKLENKESNADLKEINNYLATLDKVAFSMSIAVDVLSKIVVEKGLISKDDLNKALVDERERIVSELKARMTGAESITE